MYTALVVVSLVLALVLLGSGGATLAKVPQIIENITGVGFPAERTWMLGVLKLLGAIGLVVGLWVPAIGIAAAIGVVLYFAGAVIYHVRAHDPQIAPPAVLGLVAAAVVVLQLLTI